MKFNKKETISRKFNAHFFIVALAITVGSYFLLMDYGNYISKVNILLLPKNEKIAIHIDKVRENIIVIFEKTRDIKDSNVSIEKKDTIISVETKNKNSDEALKASVEASRGIINVASKYYSVKSDLDLRIVRENVQKNNNNIFIVILVSVILGLIISFIIQFIITIVERLISGFKINKKEVLDVSRDIEDMMIRNKSKIEELSYAPKKQEEPVDDTYYNQKEQEDNDDKTLVENILIVKEGNEGVSSFKKASSPQNLPIENIENEFTNNNEAIPNNLPCEVTDGKNKSDYLESEISQNKNEEPTDDEYKKRLNQLLKGE